MTRLVLIVWCFTLWTAAAQFPPPPPPEPPPAVAPKEPAAKEAEPPEEDEGQKPTEYAYNPLQARKEVTVGNYYFKKGKYAAALKRFQEATRWNPKYGEAYLREGEAWEKLKDEKKARESYAKFLEVAPEAKEVPQVKKKLEKK